MPPSDVVFKPLAPSAPRGYPALPSSVKVYDPDTGRSYEVAIERITPELAAAYLDTQVVNRMLKPGVVSDKLVPDITEGLFELNGETIIFDVNGVLRDGQHRLTAIAEAGVAVKSFVVRGVDPEVVRTIDTGTARTLADYLGVKGEKNRTRLGVIATAVFVHQHTGSFDAGRAGRKSISRVDDFLDDPSWMAQLREAAEFTTATCRAGRGKPPILIAGGLYGLLYILFKGKDEEIAREFFTRVFSDTGHLPGDPELALRRKLLSARENGERVVTPELAYLFITAWNHRQSRTQWRIAKTPRGNEMLRIPLIAAASTQAYLPGPLEGRA